MSGQGNNEMGFWGSMGFGTIFFLVGSFVVMISADIIPSDPSSSNAPRWVVGAAGAVFMLAGMMIALQGAFGPNPKESRLYLWLQLFLGLGLMLLFSSVFLWVGFGPGEREFSSSTSLGPVTTSGSGSERSGRLIFGGAGVFMVLMTILMAYSNLKKIFKHSE